MLARVFPRRTNATPQPSKDDEYVFVGDPPLFLPEDIDEVHVSAAFTWDLPEAERLCKAWSRIAPTKLGGPATGQPGEAFTPGRYLKQGYVITSRGCPNNCWFCSVPAREGREIRELPIVRGWNILDDNLLACSESHIRSVFLMLHEYKRTKYPEEPRPKFTGGIEAKRLKPWHVELFALLKPEAIFFANDEPADIPPLIEAMELFREVDYASDHVLRCYVLVGYPGDSYVKAHERCMATHAIGYMPMAMPYQDPTWNLAQYHEQRRKWAKFTNAWRPAAIGAKARNHKYLEEAI